MTSNNASKSKKSAKKRKAAEISNDDHYAPIPYTITCPALPLSRRKKTGNYFHDIDDPGDESLKVEYTVEPGTRWNDLKAYRKMKYVDHEFHQGNFIFVNRAERPPEPPSEDATDDELIEWQRKHMWVGRIQQVKAAKADEVLVRVFWLYWPEELPSGRAPYHGKHEMVLSNHADIIDATSMSGLADVTFWDEKDDTDAPMGQIYWRQTLDFTKTGRNGKGRLSPLRKHCKCRSEYCPDLVMYKCHVNECAIWNHQECLEERLMQELEAKLQKGSLKSYLDRRAEAWNEEREKQTWTLGETIAVGAEKVESLFHRARDSVMHQIEGRVDPSDTTDDKFDAAAALTPRSKAKAAADAVVKLEQQEQQQQTAVRTEGRLSIEIKQTGAKASVVAEVKLFPGKGPTSTETKSWEIQLDCLQCNKPLD